MDIFDTACRNKVRIGGRYIPNCHAMDGHKYVCMDDLMTEVQSQECIVYSFGIGADFTFEEMMASLGCKVYAYDPTIDTPKFENANIRFEKIGLSGKISDGKSKTLSEIILQNGHVATKISYLKMDIEGTEVYGLLNWMDSGSLTNVQQIAMEYHLNNERTQLYKNFQAALRDLQIKENFRIFHWEANLCWKNSEYFDLAEIVLKKVNPQIPC